MPRIVVSVGGCELKKKKERHDLNLVPYFKRCRLDKIDKFHIEGHKRPRRHEEVSQATINHELAVLATCTAGALSESGLTQRMSRRLSFIQRTTAARSTWTAIRSQSYWKQPTAIRINIFICSA